MRRVLVIGGYGNFGSFICQRLACDSNVQLVIGGRSRQKSMELAKALGAEGVEMDIHRNLAARLREIRPGYCDSYLGAISAAGIRRCPCLYRMWGALY
jgi:NAD(P)-dependent dehydrogenase (short-subunit alcohol dehydrogenase family)